MVKRRYSRKPKRTYKRKSYRRKRSFRKGRKYDGVIKRMILVPFDIVTTGNAASFLVNWKDDQLSGVLGDTTFRVTNQNEYQTFNGLHRQVSVRGCKMAFVPCSNLFTGGATGSVCTISSYSRTGLLPDSLMSANEIKSAVDWKEYNTARPIKKYVNVAKFLARNKQPLWYDQVQVTSSNFGTRAGTFWAFTTQGLPDGTIIGRFYIKWYVAFKTPFVA